MYLWIDALKYDYKDIEYSDPDPAISEPEFHSELTCKDTDRLIRGAVQITWIKKPHGKET